MGWPNNEILELTVGYRANLQQCLLVTHWQTQNGTNAGFTELEIQDRIVDQQKLGGNGTLTGELVNLLCVSCSINFVRAQGIFPTRWRRSVGVMNMAGVRPGVCNAQNIQASVEKEGDKGLRNNVGGMRIGGVSTTDTAQGLLVNNYFTALSTFADNYLRNLSALFPDLVTTWYPIILNKRKIPGSSPPKFEVIGGTRVTAVTAFNTIRTMSRRTFGRGD